MEKISAVLFDFDGTLVDSETLYSAANIKTLTELGLTPEHATQVNRQYFAGVRLDQRSAIFAQHLPELLPSYADYEKLYAENSALLATTITVTAKPGASELLSYLKTKGKKLALVTMSTREQVKDRCEKIGLDFAVFDYFVGGNEVPAKPDPAVYQMAMQQIGVTPAETMIVEDSNVGALAAIRAGATVVVVKDASVLSPEVLQKANYIFEKNCLNRIKELL